MRAVLPAQWFPAPPATGEAETAPVLNALLTGIGSAYAYIWTLLVYVNLQTRISTSTDVFVDATAADYFGAGGLLRLRLETDAAYITRIKASLFPVRSTRAAVSAAVQSVIGMAPVIFEPRNTGDTKAYGSLAHPAAGGGYGYGSAGLRYGSMTTPCQFFVTIPAGATAVQPAALYAAIAPVLPAGVVAWTRTPLRT